ncbi:MAG: PAS domain S-box protein [Deltaproteobacteria bacterium]|nr:PAS domain S-box protein [Deltaproteobacteria bacterium]MBZ0219733.1 PAS domain S-box protein [Deltaproteobacteria bacterium]
MDALFFKEIVEKTSEGVIVLDSDGAVRYVNPAGEALLGRNAEDLLGKEFGIPLDGSKIEIDFVRNDGDYGVAELYAERSTCLGVPSYIAYLNDITDRKKAEDALHISEESLAEAQHIAHIGSWEWDLAGSSLKCSEEIFNILGIMSEGFSETLDAFLQTVHPEDREAVRRMMVKATHAGTCSLDFRIVQPNNKERFVHCHAQPKLDRSGKVVSIIGTILDLTERKRIEEEIIKNQKLDSLGVLAGGIAHDFNNLLTGITGSISLAKVLLSPGDRAYKILSDSERAAKRAADLTNQLLVFAKGGEPVKKTIVIKEVVTEAATFALSGSKALSEFVIPATLWPVDADPGQIGQVIHNLVLNASQAMPNGGIISVCCENILPEASGLNGDAYVKISIKDQGAGIPEEYFQKIFDPYFTTKHKGNGLGLAITYSIIKKHGGHIDFSSSPGEGTTFNVYIPASISTSASTERETDESASIFKARGRVLVMDDEDIIREVAGELLECMGCEVATAGDGLEALEKYSQAFEAGAPFDAVIMDLTVPGGMGGKEAVKKLLEIDPNAKAIVSSGYSSDTIIANFKEYGFSDVILKPYTIKSFSSVLHKVLN